MEDTILLVEKRRIFCVSFGCFYLDTTQRLSAVRVQMHDSNGNTHLLPVGSVLPQHCRMKPGGFTNDLGKEGTSIFCFQQFADE